MHRYNIFNQVHKGLKALLYETALQIQHTDFWNVEESQETITKIEEVVTLFEHHAGVEDRFVFPAVEQYEPSVVDCFEQEHVKDHELGEVLSHALLAYKNASIITLKVSAGNGIQSAFLRFLVFNIDHMLKEETLLNEILWRYYSDAELIGMTEVIIRHIPPPVQAKMSGWMLRGMNVAEITTWLKGAEENAPAEIFNSLFAAAEKHLAPQRFRLVMEGLSHGIMVAG